MRVSTSMSYSLSISCSTFSVLGGRPLFPGCHLMAEALGDLGGEFLGEALGDFLLGVAYEVSLVWVLLLMLRYCEDFPDIVDLLLLEALIFDSF